MIDEEALGAKEAGQDNRIICVFTTLEQNVEGREWDDIADTNAGRRRYVAVALRQAKPDQKQSMSDA